MEEPRRENGGEDQAGIPTPDAPTPAGQVQQTYSRRQRWYIAVSVSLLVIIMVGVAFAAGVYIGNGRELAAGVNPGRRGGPPAQQAPLRFGQPPGAGPPGGFGNGAGGGAAEPGQDPGPLGAFDLVGAVVSVDESRISLRLPERVVEIAVDGATRLIDSSGRLLSRDELRPGAVVGLVLGPGSERAATVVLLRGRNG